MLYWEEIKQNQGAYLCRAKVFGGWLVKETQEVHLDIGDNHTSVLSNTGYEWTSSITFVPDANHEWKINND